MKAKEMRELSEDYLNEYIRWLEDNLSKHVWQVSSWNEHGDHWQSFIGAVSIKDGVINRRISEDELYHMECMEDE